MQQNVGYPTWEAKHGSCLAFHVLSAAILARDVLSLRAHAQAPLRSARSASLRICALVNDFSRRLFNRKQGWHAARSQPASRFRQA